MYVITDVRMYMPKIGSLEECKNKLMELGFLYIKHTIVGPIVVFHLANTSGFQTFGVLLEPFISIVIRLEGELTDIKENKPEVIKLDLQNLLFQPPQV